jgi:hypothetical protein
MNITTRFLFSFASLLLLQLAGSVAHGQTSYSGRIGDNPVRMVLERSEHGDKEASAIYAYTEYDKPISLEGTNRDSVVVLREKNDDGDVRARLTLSGFQSSPDTITGTWTRVQGPKELSIELSRNFSLDLAEEVDWGERENIHWPERYILQSATLKGRYFMLGVSKEKGESYPTTTGVKIYERGSDQLVQKIDLSGEFRSLNNIEVQDYNFDGHEDFSVFEQQYAGPNVTRIYFLYDSENDIFREKDLPGTSLTFIPEKELFQSRNQSQAGCMVTVSKYTFRGMEVELLEESCYVCNDEGKRVKREMEACE